MQVASLELSNLSTWKECFGDRENFTEEASSCLFWFMLVCLCNACMEKWAL